MSIKKSNASSLTTKRKRILYEVYTECPLKKLGDLSNKSKASKLAKEFRDKNSIPTFVSLLLWSDVMGEYIQSSIILSYGVKKEVSV